MFKISNFVVFNAIKTIVKVTVLIVTVGKISNEVPRIPQLKQVLYNRRFSYNIHRNFNKAYLCKFKFS